MKILVFGRTGQVATELLRRGGAHELTLLGREEADLTNPAACAATVEASDCDAVINAAAYTAVDRAEEEKDLAHVINADSPGAIAHAAAAKGVPFLHVSTDYVFDGSGERPWQPADATAPLSVYGRTKFAGEEAVRAAGGTYAILRTAWVFSAHGANFVKTMLRLSETRDRLNIVNDQVGGPTPAAAIADALLAMAPALAADPAKSGTYHFSGAPEVSWRSFACEIFARAGREIAVEGISTANYPTSATRPANSRLDCSDIGQVFGISRPDWKEGLGEVLAECGPTKDPHLKRRGDFSGCGKVEPGTGERQVTDRKGIILAGGSGTRLYPITTGVSKQLLPIYDKPMIYHPLTVLMLAGIREIAMITTPQDQEQFRRTLGDGSQWGLSLTYIEQPSPDGLAQAYLLAEGFLDGAASAMVLGDNIFFGHGLPELLAAADETRSGGTVFGYHVADPERYGVVDFDSNGRVRSIIEKPDTPPSNYAVTGLYFLDGTAPERARRIEPSARGELEITSLLEMYLAEEALQVKRMGRGYAWLDTGTHESLLDAGNFVRTLERRQGLQTGSPDEVAFVQGWIGETELSERAEKFGKNGYGAYLRGLLETS